MRKRPSRIEENEGENNKIFGLNMNSQCCNRFIHMKNLTRSFSKLEQNFIFLLINKYMVSNNIYISFSWG